ncbi:MAG: hypothetical protein QM778_33460 [Myxococcales bacterium]
MNELPPHLAVLIEHARGSHEPRDEDRERVLAALQASIGVGVVTAALTQAGHAAAQGLAAGTPSTLPAALSTAGVAAKYWLLGSALVIGSAAWMVWPQEAPAPAPAAVAARKVETQVQLPEDTELALPAAPVAQGAEVQPSPREQVRLELPVAQLGAHDSQPQPARLRARISRQGPVRTSARNVATRAASAPVLSSTEPAITQATQPSAPAKPESAQPAAVASPDTSEEMALIRKALSSLRDAQAEQALAYLERHAREFPHGALSHQRAGLRVVALCGAGQRERGRQERATFLASDNASALASRVRNACGEGEAP